MDVMDAAFDPAFGEAWNRRQITDALAMPSTHALVVDEDGDPIEGDGLMAAGSTPAGFVLTRHAVGEEELLLIAVRPEHRRRGLGEALITHLVAQARSRGTEKIFLEMRRGNPAVHLYEKLGFEPIGKRADYYRLSNGSRVDAITFARSV
jgi:ribosomal-protein-alanine N-acetyltransferase